MKEPTSILFKDIIEAGHDSSKENPFFFTKGSYRLFGVLHAPNEQGALARHRIGVLFCTPFAEEKMIAHRVIVNMARTLAIEGVTCMRFDFMGEGDSEGNFEDSTIKTRLSDISTALSILTEKTGVEKIGLIGIRFGGTLAALAASQVNVDPLILISPIVYGKPYVEQCLRSNLTTQIAAYRKIIKDRTQLIADLMDGHPLNIDGYLLGKELFEEMVGIDLLGDTEISAGKILVINVIKDNKQPIDHNIDRLYEKLKNNNPETSILSVQEYPFWKDDKIYSPVRRELNKTLVNWLAREIGS